MSDTLRILLLGDLVGKPGRAMFQKWKDHLKKTYRAHAIILNGENSADNGRGITPKVADFFLAEGASVVTTGNHIWDQKEIYAYLDRTPQVLRPLNFPSSCPGKGYYFLEVHGVTVAVINAQGRVFMKEDLDCPFRAVESIMPLIKSKTHIVIIDFHAETTAEKQGMAYYFDGKVSCIVGTHTHVQTADERVLPGGTAYITDLGFSGALNSMLGMRKEEALARFVTQMPHRFTVDYIPPHTLTGVCVEINTNTGKAISIERIKIVDDDLMVE